MALQKYYLQLSTVAAHTSELKVKKSLSLSAQLQALIPNPQSNEF